MSAQSDNIVVNRERMYIRIVFALGHMSQRLFVASAVYDVIDIFS